MLVYKWIQRIGDIVAPDDEYKSKELTTRDDPFTDLFRIVAPPADSQIADGENQSGGPVPPATAFLSPTTVEEQTKCVHCHQLTPIKAPNKTTRFQTPSPSLVNQTDSIREAVKEKVDLAIHKTAECNYMLSGHFEKLIVTLTSKRIKRDSKTARKLTKDLEKMPWLLDMRVPGGEGSSEKGFTPFLVAVKSNQLDVLDIILDAKPKVLEDVDLIGRTAFHIAAAAGFVDVAELLVRRMENKEEIGQLIDLTGKTPFGCAKISSMNLAKRNLLELKNLLKADMDLAIFGSPPPTMQRQHKWRGLSLVHGHAELPGERVLLEDTVFYTSWRSKNIGDVGIIGVADGHQDNKWVSEFVGDNVADVVVDKLKHFDGNWDTLFKDSCLDLDHMLEAKNLPGGSTAVIALVTRKEIVVANVGDCRCILIQKRAEQLTTISVNPEEPASIEESSSPKQIESASPGEAVPDDLNEKKEELTSTEKSPSSQSAAQTAEQKIPAHTDTATDKISQLDAYVVTALSEDHKPELDGERARIEKSGMAVAEIKFEENGEEVVIYKVKKSDTDMMAVSRSFGDFDYKTNEDLSAKEQAITAVADVRVHQRDNERDCYLILGCDGVWDVMNNEEVAQFVLESIAKSQGGSDDDLISTVSDLLVRECLYRGSKDNISVAIAALSRTADKLLKKAPVPPRALFSPEDKAKAGE